MSRSPRSTKGAPSDPLPSFVPPQLALLRKEAPSGDQWVHEIKLDGYRIHARIDGRKIKLLTRTGLDWTERYGATEPALRKLNADRAYIDGELCAVGPDGVTSFAAMQAATDSRGSAGLVYFAFDLLHLDGRDMRADALLERKAKLATLLNGADSRIRYNDHLAGDGETIFREACKLGAEGIVSKRADAAYVRARYAQKSGQLPRQCARKAAGLDACGRDRP